jgi:hypothetical protein
MPRGDRAAWGGRRQTARPDARAGGRTPDLIKAARLISDRLLRHAEKFSTETLNELGEVLRSAASSVEVELTRRSDMED